MRPIRLAAALAILLAAPAALAFGPTPEAGFVSTAQDTRAAVTPAWSTPVRATAAFDRFVAATGSWQAAWDGDTDVPVRLWGAGIPVPGAQRDPARAEAAARALIDAHLDLLAPGAAAADLALIGNSESFGLRTVTFGQRWHGLRVVGAAVTVMFKRDRLFVVGSTAMPDVAATEPGPSAVPASPAAALRWVRADLGREVAVTDTGDLVVFPEVRPRAMAGATPSIRYTVARPLVVETATGVGRWTVWTDAATGAPLARISRLLYGGGNLLYNTPDRNSQGTRGDVAAAHTTITIDGIPDVTTEHDGFVNWPTEAAASIVTSLTGPYALVFDGGGNPLAEATLPIQPGATTSWNMGTDEFADGQITTFTHLNLVKKRIRQQLDPFLPWVDSQISASVNEDQFCNAFADLDPDSVHFFRFGTIDFGGGQVFMCDNTGRMPDVVYHEVGHNLHFRSLVDTGVIADINGFFSAEIPGLSEGLGDTLSTMVTNDPAVGPGFFFDMPTVGLRNMDPAGVEKHYPEDAMSGDPHADGEIIGGAIWDTRTALVAALGELPGQAATNRLFDGILRHSSTFMATYTDAIAADDDDGNLANGTPNQCEINRHFQTHGLAAPGALTGGARIGTPVAENGAFSVPIVVPPADCPGLGVNTVNVTWRLRGDPTQTGTVPLTSGASWTGPFPQVAEGSVLQYQVAVLFSDGSTVTRPLNAADPYYEAYVGPVTQIFCDNFESDMGWDHTGPGDEWERALGGTAPAAGDPDAAASGTTIFGTDVTDNGLYAGEAATSASSPAIDTSGYATVRLQYKRWLDVDDGFYDQATISVGATELWANAAGADAGSATNLHRDGEWRFHDVDLTAAAAGGSINVTFGLTTDASRGLGGWNLDDVCVVGIGATCGDTFTRGAEECDDGNVEDGDGCSALCAIELDEGGGCCQAGTDPTGALAVTGFGALGLLVVLRRRRRR